MDHNTASTAVDWYDQQTLDLPILLYSGSLLHQNQSQINMRQLEMAKNDAFNVVVY
jgi:hypothetical protein